MITRSVLQINVACKSKTVCFTNESLAFQNEYFPGDGWITISSSHSQESVRKENNCHVVFAWENTNLIFLKK